MDQSIKKQAKTNWKLSKIRKLETMGDLTKIVKWVIN